MELWGPLCIYSWNFRGGTLKIYRIQLRPNWVFHLGHPKSASQPVQLPPPNAPLIARAMTTLADNSFRSRKTKNPEWFMEACLESLPTFFRIRKNIESNSWHLRWCFPFESFTNNWIFPRNFPKLSPEQRITGPGAPDQEAVFDPENPFKKKKKRVLLQVGYVCPVFVSFCLSPKWT